MLDYVKLLREFQTAVFQKTGNYRMDISQRFIPDNPTAHLRADLLLEEADELADALLNGEAKDVLKELCDVLYVVFAIAAIYNLPVEEAFKEVHANNMLKLAKGITGKNGKFVKAKDHPKVDLQPLLDLQKEIKNAKAEAEYTFFE